MALVNFYKGLKASYSEDTHKNGIYVCTDSRDVYFFGILQYGFTEEQYQAIIDQSEATLSSSYAESDAGYPAAGDTISTAIAKLHSKTKQLEDALTLHELEGALG